MGAECGLWATCSAELLGAAGTGWGHAGWAVFVNLLETSAYSPWWHLGRSLTWPPRHRTPSLIASRTHTPRRLGAAERSARLGVGSGGEEGRGLGGQGCRVSKARVCSGSDTQAHAAVPRD